MEGLTIADVMALQRRDYGYGDGYCYHRGGRGMAATGIGLGAGLGGAALVGVILTAALVNQASKARMQAAQAAANGNTKLIEVIANRIIHDDAKAGTFNLDVTQSLRSLNGATGGTATAQAEALALLLNGGGNRGGQVCPTPVAIYQPAMPCACNTCAN